MHQKYSMGYPLSRRLSMEAPQSAPDCCSGSPTQASFPPGLAEKARLFKALGDEVRLKLLFLVRHQEVCVCDLMDAMEMPQGTLSHHLGVLLQAGLVSVRKQGRWNYYQATPEAKAPLAIFQADEAGLVPHA
jgi:ArsR family transcriptional regulator